MIKRQLLTTLFGLLCLSSAIQAEPVQQSQQSTTLIKNRKDNKQQRPKAPDRQIVTCAYDREDLNLTFVIPEGKATLSVTDETLLTATYDIDTTPLEVSVAVGSLIGTICIELETENGNTYYGTM